MPKRRRLRRLAMGLGHDQSHFLALGGGNQRVVESDGLAQQQIEPLLQPQLEEGVIDIVTRSGGVEPPR